jgi:hypothetical protein
MQQPEYNLYATLLDSYTYYLSSEKDEAYQNFIDRLNRKPFKSEAAEKGTAFNELIDFCIPNLRSISFSSDTIKHKGFEFKKPIVHEFLKRLEGAQPQVFVEGRLETSKGMVKLYGYTDEILMDCVIDIKTTQYYTFPYYLSNWQHLVYPYCLRQQGVNINRFKYMVTDFTNYYEEEYLYNEQRDTAKLVDICEQLIDFIEINRELITDKKLFNQHEVV